MSKHREEARVRWIADLLGGLGRPEIAAALRHGDIGGSTSMEDDLLLVPGRSGYAALAIETGGIIPLVASSRAERSASIIETANLLKRGTALVLLDRATTERAVLRAGSDYRLDGGSGRQWWSRDAKADFSTPESAELPFDGVTFRTIVDDIEFPDAETLA